MAFSRYLFLIVFTFFAFWQVQAQQTHVNLTLGAQTNRISDFGPQYILIPSLEIERKLIQGKAPEYTNMHAALTWSYWKWRENTLERYNSPFTSLTRREHILGMRLVFYGMRQKLSTRIFVGASWHWLLSTHMNDDIRSAVPRWDFKDRYWSFDPGLKVNVPVFERIEAIGSILLSVPLVADKDAGYKTALRFVLGAGYRL